MTPNPIKQEQNIILRPLCADDFQDYKALRLKALASNDNKFFVATSPPENTRSNNEWQKVCTETCNQYGRGTHVIIGSFWKEARSTQLIGSAISERWSEDKSGQTAFYRAIYVHPDYRIHGLGEKITHALDAWSSLHGYTKLIFTVRADKKKWLNKQMKVFNASIKKTNSLSYVNGDEASTHYLERSLIKYGVTASTKQATYG